MVSLETLLETVQGELEWAFQGKIFSGSFLSPDGSPLEVSGMNPPELVTSDQVTVVQEKKNLQAALASSAKVLVLQESFKPEFHEWLQGPLGKQTPSVALLWVKDAYLALAKLSALLVPKLPFPWGPEVSDRAFIGDGVEVGEGSFVAPGAVLEKGVQLGRGCRIHPGVVLCQGIQLGDEVELFPNVVLYPGTRVGSRVRIHSGSVIGSDGFGYARQGMVSIKIHHGGGVVIGDDVEIGSNSCVDRGTFGDTIIHSHVKIDNLVQIAHNCHVGECTVICGMSGLAGSVHLGKANMVGGRCSINKTHTGTGVMFAGGTGSHSKKIPDGAVLAGIPDRPYRDWMKIQKLLDRLPEMARTVKDLKKHLDKKETP